MHTVSSSSSARRRWRNAIFWLTTGYSAIKHWLTIGHKPTIKQIGSYYDYVSEMFELLCNGNLHAGYWESPADPTSLANAQDRFTEQLIGHTLVSTQSRLLDVGCGNGTPALALVRKTGCSVVGITLSEEQTRVAQQRAVEASLERRARFLRTNAMNLPFGKETFDAAWALESIFHMERSRALSEMSRILRPGSRVVLTDLIEKRPLTKQEQTLIYALSHSHTVVRLEHYPALLENAGFRVVDVIDISTNVERSFAEVARLIERHREMVVRLYGRIAVEFMLRMFPQVTAIYEQKLGYAVVIGEKSVV